MGTILKEEVPDYLRGESQKETSENSQLYAAAINGDIKQLILALDKGANPNYFHRHDDGTPGVLHAVARNVSENDAALCAKELIGRGARISAALISNRNTPIHEAATAGSEEVCRVLIDALPTCTEHENSFGNTALHAAARSGSVDIVRLLLEKGADPNKENHRGSTALHIACFLAGAKSLSLQSTLVDPFVNIAAVLICNDTLEVDIKDVNGYTALHIAAQRGCNDMVKLLIDSGASLKVKTDVDSKGRGGRTPAGMAAFAGQETTRELLDEAAAAIDRGENVVTKKMARDLEFGYSVSKPIVGSAMAVAKIRLEDR